MTTSSQLMLLNPIYRDIQLNYSVLQHLNFHWKMILPMKIPFNIQIFSHLTIVKIFMYVLVYSKILHSTPMLGQTEQRCCGAVCFYPPGTMPTSRHITQKQGNTGGIRVNCFFSRTLWTRGNTMFFYSFFSPILLLISRRKHYRSKSQ